MHWLSAASPYRVLRFVAAQPSGKALILMMAVAGSMFLFAVALSIGGQRHDAEAEDLLQSLQASARCASSFSKPEL